MKNNRCQIPILNQNRATIIQNLRNLIDPEMTGDEEQKMDDSPEELEKFGMKHASLDEKQSM